MCIYSIYNILSSYQVWININDMTINDNIIGFIDENALVVACVIRDPSTPVRVCMRANEVTSNDCLKFSLSPFFPLTNLKNVPAFLLHPSFHFSHSRIMSLSQVSWLSLSITDNRSNLSTNIHLALKH